jgi:LysR family nitrogen assimilation transcriptional regulator
MDLKQLQLLADIVDAGSITKVCAARGVAQSALSKQIAGLEQDFSAKLFYRTGRGVVLTEFGQAIMPRVRTVLAECEGLRDEIRARAGVPSGPVRLEVLASLTQFLAGELFRRIRHDYPRIELRMMEGFSGHIEDSLANGRADVGVLARYGSHGLRTDEILRTDELYLIGPPNDKLTARKSLHFDELANLPLVLPGAPDGVRMMLADIAKKRGIALNIEIEVDSLTAMKEIVACGAGYTILTRQAVLAELESQRLCSTLIIEPTLSRTLVLVMSGQRPLTSAGRIVIGLIRQRLAGEAGTAP